MGLIKNIIFVIIFTIAVYNCYSETITKYEIVSIKKDTFDIIRLDSSLFVIAMDYGYSCFDCFKHLSLTLDSLNYTYIFLVKCANNSQARRNRLDLIRSINANAKVFFDIYDANSLFSKYNIKETPSLIYIHNSTYKYISYNTFKTSNYNYRKQIKLIKE